ncbi:hypothetical protein LSM04_003111 [Trypanosoma melophagium]|uniref:uncharacterized protein n=1 Tax=Trypanosoma melophagium TaxID=715481 RepID=UPI00351A7EF2|nr:hypothetical protein LSM04_003111 [Trypanosoma melophagium]
MLHANDHTANDTLHNFTNALQRAQQALQQEETRLAQLTHTVREQQDRNNTLNDIIRRQQQPQLEALRQEIARVRSITLQHTIAVEEQEKHLNSVRRPREAAEAESEAHKQKQQQHQRRYLAISTAVHSQLARWLQPGNGLEVLQRTVRRREVEVGELQRVILALQEQLEKEVSRSHTGGKYPTDEKSEKSKEEEETEKEEETEEEPTTMMLEQQLQEQQAEKERFMQECSDVLSARRGELEGLKFKLKQLCADVEAADAAQQVAQQQFNTALNQQSETRVLCEMCGKDIMDSFIS